MSDGIGNFGEPKWQLVMCLMLAWFICFLCLLKGIKTTGKVCIVWKYFNYPLYNKKLEHFYETIMHINVRETEGEISEWTLKRHGNIGNKTQSENKAEHRALKRRATRTHKTPGG
jgi:hypothetical protein